MRNRATFLSFSILVLVLFMTGCSLSGAQPKTGEVIGHVVDLDNEPVHGATVKLGDRETETDENGVFSLQEIQYGAGTISIIMDGEVVSSRDILINSESTIATFMIGNLISNFDFSQGVGDEGIPVGFRLAGALRGDVSLGLTDEKTNIGQYSLKFMDNSEENSIWLNSEDRFPASAGQTFRAEVDALAERGSLGLYLEFQQGNQRIERKSISLTSDDPEWKTFSVTFTAPAGTETVYIYLATSVAGLSTVYVDNIRLYQVQ